MRAAEDVLMENTLIRMDSQGYQRLLASDRGTAKPVPEMVELARRSPPWETAGKTSQG